MNPGVEGVCSHRLERLIHLELADLVVHMPYLKDFPNITSPALDETPNTKEDDDKDLSSKLTVPAVKYGRQSLGPCPDCE